MRAQPRDFYWAVNLQSVADVSGSLDVNDNPNYPEFYAFMHDAASRTVKSVNALIDALFGAGDVQGMLFRVPGDSKSAGWAYDRAGILRCFTLEPRLPQWLRD